MKLFKLKVALISLFLFSINPVFANCESGHWIQSKTNDGSIITLEDGSIWQVSAIDRIDSMLWLPIDNIVVCDGKLIDTDDGTSVEATRIN